MGFSLDLFSLVCLWLCFGLKAAHSLAGQGRAGACSGLSWPVESWQVKDAADKAVAPGACMGDAHPVFAAVFTLVLSRPVTGLTDHGRSRRPQTPLGMGDGAVTGKLAVPQIGTRNTFHTYCLQHERNRGLLPALVWVNLETCQLDKARSKTPHLL